MLRASIVFALIASAQSYNLAGVQTRRPATVSRAAAVPVAGLSLERSVAGIGAAYLSLSRPVQVGMVGGVVAAAALVLVEIKKRDNLVESGEDCMLGDEEKCEAYDKGVDSTPTWKLKLAAPKLSLTNKLADKLGGAPPAGFEWGKTV